MELTNEISSGVGSVINWFATSFLANLHAQYKMFCLLLIGSFNWKTGLSFLQLPHWATISPIHFSSPLYCLWWNSDIRSTPKMITPHLLDSSLSLSVSHLCSRSMKGHNHRCHAHTHTRLKIMRLFWEYYNAGNNTDNDDDNFTMSVTVFDRTGWIFGACVLRKFWISWSRKCNLCGKCKLWILCFFKSHRQPEAQERKVCESLLYGSCCEVPLRSLDDT